MPRLDVTVAVVVMLLLEQQVETAVATNAVEQLPVCR